MLANPEDSSPPAEMRSSITFVWGAPVATPKAQGSMTARLRCKE
jgi:hypothetical protein